MDGEFCFAHLSDWHATTLKGGGGALWHGKRLSGFASWALSRHRYHDPAILSAAIRDVHEQVVDRVLVTGDLTHVSLEREFIAAAEQLSSLGPPDKVFLVPGNHDCYVPTDPAKGWDHWASYLASDAFVGDAFVGDAAVGDAAMGDAVPSELASVLTPPAANGRAPRHEDFPTIRVSGKLAMIGLCSAIPTPVFRAGGELGVTQLKRLEETLRVLGDRGFFRVVMIHHPVAAKGEPVRRALRDGEALRGVLGRVGADLVLHGHKHRRRVNRVPGPNGEVPIIGVPSSSEIGSKPGKAAQYHLYRVRENLEGGDGEGDGAGRFKIDAEIRGYDRASGTFVRVEEDLFA